MKLSLKREPRYSPRKPRSATFIATVILLPDDREIGVEVKNISTDGFMAHTGEELLPETRFGISIPGRGIVRAEIRWADGTAFGARFDRPLQLLEVKE
ncbi:MAG: PilZ domain-containing protein [Pseudomonadota bacterium]|nr:PilZ domain-containing protein [Pseudomonadota bacterium]